MKIETLKRKIVDEITKPTDRGKQHKIGPSEIGGCPLCLGEKLALAVPDLYPDLEHTERFGLGSWIGTAVHSYMDENVLIPNAYKEHKNLVYDLKGYGEIWGSTDLFVDGHVVDYKVVGKWSFNEMKLAYQLESNRLPNTKYRVQQHLYGYGWVKAGKTVDTVNLCVIPKLSNDPDDITFYTEVYNPEVAEKALKRLELIWSRVKAGKLESLPMDEDCYVCSRVLYRN